MKDIVRHFRRARERSLSVKGAKMFNLLPSYIRNINADKVDQFKNKLDKFLIHLKIKKS